jgi:oxygen-independent coproporphyrinogen III oxidase
MKKLLTLLNKYNIPGGRYTYYPFHSKWNNDLNKVEWISKIQKESPEKVDLYLHIPFCHSLCTFCGCNIKIMKNKSENELYIDALIQEWKQYNVSTTIDTLYLGGGTPNFFTPKELSKILNNFTFTKDPLITMEIDPRFVTKEDLISYKEIGINRLSFGIQDFNEKVLANVNRAQDINEIIDILNFSHTLNFKAINIDLIYGLALQSIESFKETIKIIKNLNITSVSLYPFAKVPWQNNSQKAYGEMQDFTLEELNNLQSEIALALEEIDFVYFGMGHFSKSKEKLFRNIMGFIPRKNEIQIGLGVSAISSTPYGHLQNEKIFNKYIQSTSEANPYYFKAHHKTKDEHERQIFFTEVICENFISLNNIQKFKLDKTEQLLKEFEDTGLIKKVSNGFAITPLGRYFHKTILQHFDPNFIGQ